MQVVENELRQPTAGEVRIKVLAVPVCAPDVTARYGQSPFVPRPPYTPGYAFIGVVEAIGDGVTNTTSGDLVAGLTAYGSYAEMVYWHADQLIPVPRGVDYGEAATLILNYIVAYHALHLQAQVKSGDHVLIIGASGGIGTAFLQLGALAGLKMYGVASKNKHPILEKYAAIPIDYHTQDFIQVIRELEPGGLEAVFDGMAGDSFKQGYSLLKRGGTLVGYGNPLSYSGMLKMLGLVAMYSLLPDGRRAKYYSTGISRIKWQMFLEDWGVLFKLLETGEIKPVIHARFPILEARAANQMLESGSVIGNIVLVAPELI